jgi:P4 family phage/plasmid primase-like protien
VPDSVNEWAKEYQRRGFALCKLAPGEKRPTYKGWTSRGLDPEEFGDDDNIGILTGRLSGDLVCIDLDSPAALEMADKYLPHTGMVDGRPGKPRSHRWCRVTHIPPELTAKPDVAGGIGGPRTKRFRHGETGETIVELLGTGGQAVVPPSLHISGERRIWDENGEPVELRMADLMDAVRALAAECGWRPNTKRKQEKSGSGRLLPPEERIHRAKRFVLKEAPLARARHGGHDTTFHVARKLRNDFALPDKAGRRLFGLYNQRLAEAGEEPWTEQELDHKWEDAAAANPAYPYGCNAGFIPPPKPANDPARLADEFLDDCPWAFWHSLYFRYNGKRYVEVPRHEASALLTGHVEKRLEADYAARLRDFQLAPAGQRPPARQSVNKGLVTNALQVVESRALVKGTRPMPSRLSEGAPVNWLALDNGLLDLDAGTLGPHTSDWFSTACLPYRYEPAAKCEHWLTMLQQNLEGDDERIALLQEFFGYCLVPSTDAQACLVLAGEGGNGKSAVLAGLHALLGDENVSTVPLEGFGQRFAMVQTLGKLANIVAEVGELDRTAEGTLKAFVSGDRMTFEHKGRDPFTGRPTARLVISTNNLPRFSDKTNGVWRRLLLVPFNRRVPDSERVPGMDKPEWWLRQGEVPGILNWALAGLSRLRSNGMRFTEPAVCRAALDTHRRESDPAREFLLEHFEASPNAPPLKTAEVYEAYREWCEKNGQKHPLTAPAFGKQVRRVFGLEESRSHRFGPGPGGVQKAWSGLARRTPAVTPLPAVTESPAEG